MNNPDENPQKTASTKVEEHNSFFLDSENETETSNSNSPVNYSTVDIKAPDDEVRVYNELLNTQNKILGDFPLCTNNSLLPNPNNQPDKEVNLIEEFKSKILQQSCPSTTIIVKGHTDIASKHSVYNLDNPDLNLNILNNFTREEKGDNSIAVDIYPYCINIISEPLNISTAADVMIAKHEIITADKNTQPGPVPANQPQEENVKASPHKAQVIAGNDPKNVGKSPQVKRGDTSGNAPDGDDDKSPYAPAFRSKEIRMRFVQRVYTLLSIQLLLAFIYLAIVTFWGEALYFVYHNYIAYLVVIGLSVTIYILLICIKRLRRLFPLNFILMTILTLSVTFLLGVIPLIYHTTTILISAGITTMIYVLITVWSCTTSVEVTSWGVAILFGVLLIIMFVIVAVLMQTELLLLIVCCVICLAFTMFLIYDTLRIMGGKREDLSPEEYIFAAVSLYVHVVLLFWSLVMLVHKCIKKRF